jgi:ACT domain-containing protein
MLTGETRSLTLASADQVGALSEILAAIGQAKRTSAPVVGG